MGIRWIYTIEFSLSFCDGYYILLQFKFISKER